MKTVDPTSSITTAQTIIEARLSCLPATCTIEWAKVSSLGAPRDRAAVQYTYPLVGLWQDYGANRYPVYYGVDKVNSAIEYAVENDTMSFATRYFHGIPDNVESQDELLQPVNVPDTPLEYPVVTTETWYDLVGSYLAVLRDNTMMWKKTLVQGGTQWKMSISPIVRIYVRRLRSRKVGMVFGRQVGRATPR